MRIIPLDPKDFPDLREAHRGRVSYPILKQFLEMKIPMGQLDREGMQQSFQSLYSSLTAYTRSHSLPIKIMSRQGEIVFVRLDMDKDGNIDPDWVPPEKRPPGTITPITPEVVAERAQKEKGKVTK